MDCLCKCFCESLCKPSGKRNERSVVSDSINLLQKNSFGIMTMTSVAVTCFSFYGAVIAGSLGATAIFITLLVIGILGLIVTPFMLLACCCVCIGDGCSDANKTTKLELNETPNEPPKSPKQPTEKEFENKEEDINYIPTYPYNSTNPYARYHSKGLNQAWERSQQLLGSWNNKDN